MLHREKNLSKTERPAPKESARFLTPTTAERKTCKQTVSTGTETRLTGAESQELLFTPVICDLTKSTSLNYLCKCKCYYLLKSTSGNICKAVTFWDENSHVSFFLLFIVSWKEKGDYQKLEHLRVALFLLGAPWLLWDFSFFHTRNYKATKLGRKHLSSKRIPQQTHGRVGKTSGTANPEQTCLYGFMAASS